MLEEHVILATKRGCAMSQIDDPVKLVNFCNKKISELETLKVKAEDLKDVLKIEFAIQGYSELLEKGLHQMYQQGRSKSDISVKKDRQRYVA